MAPLASIFIFQLLHSLTASFLTPSPPCYQRSFTQRKNAGEISLKAEMKTQHEETDGSGPPEYKNAVTNILSNFINNKNISSSSVSTKTAESMEIIETIDFQATKLSSPLKLETLASILDAELYEKEWFVTGNVNPIYFADDFEFQDPDVKIDGIEEYARGVNKLFDQDTSRAEIISSVVSSTLPNTITVTWRLSGNVNIGPVGLSIKPYICYTDFTVDENSGLIVFQEDRFDIPQWDILLSALFPFLIGRVTAPEAPPVDERNPIPLMPKDDVGVTGGNGYGKIFDDLYQAFGQIFK